MKLKIENGILFKSVKGHWAVVEYSSEDRRIRLAYVALRIELNPPQSSDGHIVRLITVQNPEDGLYTLVNGVMVRD